MSSSILDQILACPALPTPPGVAIQILDLTRSPSVTVAQIGRLVQSDPALSAKVLKTINSSLFCLPQPVTKIERALALLGLNAVKSLVLGFSLVDCTRSIDGDSGLDLQAYWRRGIYSAAGARNIAVIGRVCDPDEAFTAAIFQDMGILASFLAAPEEYRRALAAAGADHEQLCQAESRTLGITHPLIGAALAERWKLPQRYVDAIKHHHSPETAEGDNVGLTRAVFCGGILADALSSATPSKALARLLSHAGDWFGMTTEGLDDLLHKVASGARDLAKVFEKDVGPAPNIQAILSEANEQSLTHQIESQRQTVELKRQNEALAQASVTDALTKARNRTAFDKDLASFFADCRHKNRPFSVIFADADRFKSVNDQHGHLAGDAVLMELADRFRRVIETVAPNQALAYRYGGEEFAILLPEHTAQAAAVIAEKLRIAIQQPAFDLSTITGVTLVLPVTVSLGVAAWEPGQISPVRNGEQLVKAADEAMYASKQAGRNRVTIASLHGETAAPNAASPMPPQPPTIASISPAGNKKRILLVEEDALAAKLLLLAFGRRTDCDIQWVATFGEASTMLMEASSASMHAVIADATTPAAASASLTMANKPSDHGPRYFLMGSPPTSDYAFAIDQERITFVTKRELCENLASWIVRILSTAAPPRRLAA